MSEALIGVLIGGAITLLASLGGQFIQAKASHRRELMRLAMESALQARQSNLELLRKNLDNGQKQVAQGSVSPLSAYLFYNTKLLQLVDKNRLNAKTLQQLDQELEKLQAVIQEADRKYDCVAFPLANHIHPQNITPPSKANS